MSMDLADKAATYSHPRDGSPNDIGSWEVCVSVRVSGCVFVTEQKQAREREQA